MTEVASNDGYLLQHFVARGIPVLGIEPAANIAEVARGQGHPDRGAVPRRRRPAARSPPSTAGPISSSPTTCSPTSPTSADFAAGLRALVKDTGVVTLEFPHLLRLIERRQFDTIYHEHYQYFSLLTASRVLETRRAAGGRRRGARHPRRLAAGLRAAGREPPAEPSERGQGGARPRRRRPACTRVAGHAGFADEVLQIKSDLLEFLLGRREPRQVGRRLRRPGQGQHAAQPLRHPVRPARLTRSTAARTSRASSCRARTSPSTRRSGWPRPGPTTSSSCRGTCGRRSASNWTTCAHGAAPARLPDPGARSHLSTRSES